MTDPSSVFSAEAGPPGGHYSHAMVAGDFIFTAGHIAVDGDSGTLKGATMFDQTIQVVKNLRSVLEAAGSSLDRVLKTTVFLVDIGDFPEFNRAYAEAFGDHRPARSTVAVTALAKGALVEIECVALCAGGKNARGKLGPQAPSSEVPDGPPRPHNRMDCR